MFFIKETQIMYPTLSKEGPMQCRADAIFILLTHVCVCV